MQYHINQLSQTLIDLQDSDAEAIVWVPGENVVMHQIAPPTAPKRKWPELVPWLLEDKVLAKVESLHFVLAEQVEQDADNQESTDSDLDVKSIMLDVATVSKEDIQLWSSKLTDHGLYNCQLLPDYFALPWRPDCIAIAQRGDLIIVRHAHNNGFVAQASLAWPMIAKFKGETPKKITLLSFMPVDLIPVEFHDSIEPVQEQVDWNNASSSLGLKMNLLSGNFKQERESNSNNAWWATAVLVLFCIGLGFVYLNSVNVSLLNQLEHSQTQYTNAVSRMFPSLNIASMTNAGNVRSANDLASVKIAIEDYQQSRFLQRESLDASVIKILIELDSIISNCNVCSMESISLTQFGGEINIKGGDQLNLSQVLLPGFRFESSRSSGDGTTLVRIVSE